MNEDADFYIFVLSDSCGLREHLSACDLDLNSLLFGVSDQLSVLGKLATALCACFINFALFVPLLM